MKNEIHLFIIIFNYFFWAGVSYVRCLEECWHDSCPETARHVLQVHSYPTATTPSLQPLLLPPLSLLASLPPSPVAGFLSPAVGCISASPATARHVHQVHLYPTATTPSLQPLLLPPPSLPPSFPRRGIFVPSCRLYLCLSGNSSTRSSSLLVAYCYKHLSAASPTTSTVPPLPPR